MSLPDSDLSKYCAKKSFEVSYALFRIAGSVRSRTFGDHLEAWATRLLSDGVGENPDGVRKSIKAIEYFLRLGAEMGLISTGISDTVVNEMRGLDSAIAELYGSAIYKDVNLEGIFSRTRQKPKRKQEEQDHEEVPQGIKETVVEVHEDNSAKDSAIVEGRESAIIDKIRQFGNCRMRDIQEALPDLSERSIRYYLQDMVERGILERVGTSGPSTFYRIKEQVEQA